MAVKKASKVVSKEVSEPEVKKLVKEAKVTKPKVEKVVVEEVVAEVKAEVMAELTKEVVGIPSLKELLESGAHFGHVVRRWNPKMKPYIYAEKNGIHIIDLFKTRENLIKACEYLEETLKSGKKIMLIGTKGQASELIRTEALRLGIPYITTRWVGGLFTNWDQIKLRVNKLIDMRHKYEAGEYKKYTKKEQVDLKRIIDRLDRMYGGLVGLENLPTTVFVIDPSREVVAVREAIARKITIVAVADTNCDPTNIAYVIPANDDAIKSVTLVVSAVLAAIERGLKAAKNIVKN
ncbi:MAG: 30S ribosomal protein S2 [bacterium]